MSVPHLKEKAKNMGLREVLEERLSRCENEQVIVQIKHIFAKMDEEIPPDDNSRQAWKQQYVIDETDKEDDLDEDDDDQVEKKVVEIKSEKKSPVVNVEDEYGSEGCDDGENEEEDDNEEDEDEKMSISDFS